METETLATPEHTETFYGVWVRVSNRMGAQTYLNGSAVVYLDLDCGPVIAYAVAGVVPDRKVVCVRLRTDDPAEMLVWFNYAGITAAPPPPTLAPTIANLCRVLGDALIGRKGGVTIRRYRDSAGRPVVTYTPEVAPPLASGSGTATLSREAAARMAAARAKLRHTDDDVSAMLLPVLSASEAQAERIKALLPRVATAVAERDAALAACKAVVEWLDHHDVPPGFEAAAQAACEVVAARNRSA